MRLHAHAVSTVALSAVFLCLPTSAAAASVQAPPAQQERALRLREEVTVTADRVEVPSGQLGSSVTVITAEELRASGVHWLSDALATVAGVVVARTGGPGAATSVFLRGTNSNHTLVLVDGMKANSPSTGAYDFSKIPASAIERVEIVRGPQSVLYGSEAIGGVINIITRRGSDAQRVSVMLDGGSYGTFRATADVQGSSDAVDYAVSFERFSNDGFSAADAANGNTEADGFGNTSFTGRVALSRDEGFGAELQLAYFDGETRIDGYDFSAGPVDDPARLQSSREVFGGGAITYRRGIYSGRFAASVSDQKLGTVDPDGFFTAFDLDTKITEFDLQNDLRFNADNTTVMGIEHRRESAMTISTSDFGAIGFDESVDTTGIYALHRYSHENLHLTGGLRYTDHSRFGSKTTYRVTVAWATPSGFRAHGSVGTAFRAPSLNDLYFPGFSNPDLEAEESTGWDAGVGGTFADGRVGLDATWFRNDVENLIQYVFPAGIVNIGEARTQGVEFAANWLVHDRVRLDATYTYTDAKDVRTGLQLLRRPEHEAWVGVRYQPSAKVNLFIEGRFKGKRSDFGTLGAVELPAYAVLNLAVQLRVHGGLEFVSRLENLTDHEYQDVWGYGTAGRSGYAGLRYGWSGR